MFRKIEKKASQHSVPREIESQEPEEEDEGIIYRNRGKNQSNSNQNDSVDIKAKLMSQSGGESMFSQPFQPKKKKEKRISAVQPESTSSSQNRGKKRKIDEVEERKKDKRRKIRQAIYSLEDNTEDSEAQPETFSNMSQKDILRNVDVNTARKAFRLYLDYGPYNIAFDPTGRTMAFGGEKGHLASIAWEKMEMGFEIQLQQKIRDMKYLHDTSMLAVAQRRNVFIYDDEGVELHHVRRLHRVNALDFLPYHFLLVSGNDHGFVQYLDVSLGEIVGQCRAPGPVICLSHNPQTGIVASGSSAGIVNMFAPSSKDPVMRARCHRSRINDISISQDGFHMATVGTDSYLRLWDIRHLSEPYFQHRTRRAPTQVDFSQSGKLAYNEKGRVKVIDNAAWTPRFNDDEDEASGYEKDKRIGRSYLSHLVGGVIHSLSFVPYEDFIALGSDNGISLAVVPGSGEANIDATEVNPYEDEKGHQDTVVRKVIDKIPPDMIALNPDVVSQSLDSEAIAEEVQKLEEKNAANLAPQGVPGANVNKKKKAEKTGGKKKPNSSAVVNDMVQRSKRKEQVQAAEEQEKKRKEQFYAPSEQFSALDRFKQYH